MDCVICNQQQVGKNEALFSIKLNNHNKNVNEISANEQFQKTSEGFNKHARSRIIDSLPYRNLAKRFFTENVIQRKKILNTVVTNSLS